MTFTFFRVVAHVFSNAGTVLHFATICSHYLSKGRGYSSGMAIGLAAEADIHDGFREVSNKCIAVRKVATPLRKLTGHLGSHCYLPPGRGDIPALTPAEAGTRLSDPGGMQS